MTFQRNQVTWAIAALRNNGYPCNPVPDAVAATVKRLIDVDRRMAVSFNSGPGWERRYAFLPKAPTGTGTELPLSEEEAFGLAIGVELDAFGASQTDIIKTLRVLRPEWQHVLKRVYGYPESRLPNLATAEATRALAQGTAIKHAEKLVFLTLSSLATTRLLSTVGRDSRILNLQFGAKAMAAFLVEQTSIERTHVVIELANLAVTLGYFLDRAPLRKRGRPAQS